jgi:hypothetical protein
MLNEKYKNKNNEKIDNLNAIVLKLETSNRTGIPK